MTIQEAIKSELEFKREGWSKWLTKDTLTDVDLITDDVMADDWITRDAAKVVFTDGDGTFKSTPEEIEAMGKIPIKFMEVKLAEDK